MASIAHPEVRKALLLRMSDAASGTESQSFRIGDMQRVCDLVITAFQDSDKSLRLSAVNELAGLLRSPNTVPVEAVKEGLVFVVEEGLHSDAKGAARRAVIEV